MIPDKLPATLIDQSFFILQKTSDMAIHCIIEYAGQLDRDCLEQAIQATIEIHPILRYRFVPDRWRPYWERVGTEMGDDVAVLEVVCTTKPEHEVHEFLSMPINCRTGPQIRMRLIRAVSDTLCIKMSHVLSDGQGAKEYAYLLSHFYTAYSTDKRHSTKSARIPAPSSQQQIVLLPFRDRIRSFFYGLAELPSVLFPKALPEVLMEKNGSKPRVIHIRKIGAEAFKRLECYSRKTGATINDLALTAFIRALFGCSGDTNEQSGEFDLPIWVQTSADLRRYLPRPPISTLRNLSGAVYLTIGTDPGKDFNETLERVHRLMRAKKEQLIGLGNWAVISSVFNILPFAWTKRLLDWGIDIGSKTRRFPLMISNTGVIDPKRLEFGDSSVNDAFLLAPIMYPPFFCLAMSTYKDTITVSSGQYGTEEGAIEIENLFDRFISQLPI